MGHLFLARGDPSFPDARLQAGRIATSKQEMTKQADALILERMQTKMRFLEDSNTVMQTRNQNLIAENKVLTSQWVLIRQLSLNRTRIHEPMLRHARHTKEQLYSFKL